jgi:hypothetical protein
MTDNHTEVFTNVYKMKVWGNNGSSSYSGSSGGGSSVELNQPYIRFIRDFLTSRACRTVVDIGCGDFRCGPSLYDDLDISYTGYDVYEDLIRYLRVTHTSPKYSFEVLDSYNQRDAIRSADVCILKDVVQHWPNDQITTFLDFLVSKKLFKYILLCNCYNQADGRDIPLGKFRPLREDVAPLRKYAAVPMLNYSTKRVLLIDCSQQVVWPIAKLPRVRMTVITCSKTREAVMQKQLADVGCSFPVSFLQGSTPANSGDFLPTNVVDWYKRYLCCLRSHFRAIAEAGRADAPPYTLVLEDDADLHTRDFEPVVQALLDDFDAGRIPEAMVSIGWVPHRSYSEYEALTSSEQSVPGHPMYHYFNHHKFGLQGYIVRRDSLSPILPIITKPTFAEYHAAIHKAYTGFTCDIGYADNAIPILLKIRRIFPPLVIERDVESTLELKGGGGLTHGAGCDHERTIWSPFFKGRDAERELYWTQRAQRPLVETALRPRSPLVVAILAKNKAATLPFYLDCILHQTLSKADIHLYIRTNDNTDETAVILRTFVETHGHKYASVYYNDTSVSEEIKRYGNHEWNAIRFKVLGQIRQDSVSYAKAKGAHYFVADCDNFITPPALEHMMANQALGVVAPMLTTPTMYSNYHYDIDANGYMKEHPVYKEILMRKVVGCIAVPVVHCTYFVHHDLLEHVCYDDNSSRYEYVIFSDTFRKKGIRQYIDNRHTYGFITFTDTRDAFQKELTAHFDKYIRSYYKTSPIQQIPTFKIWLCGGLGNRLFQIASTMGLARTHGCAMELAGALPCGSHGDNLYSWLFDGTPPPQRDFATCRTAEAAKGVRTFEQLRIHHMGHHAVNVRSESTLFYGFFQSERYFSHIRKEVLARFQPPEDVRAEIASYEGWLRTPLASTVAIHVRLGDFLTDGIKQLHFINLEAYYKRCVDHICSTRTTKESLSFLVVCEESDRIHAVYPELIPMLKSRGTVVYSGKHARPEFDLFLLASCGTVVSSNSTFAWWGGWLNQRPDKRVYHPDRWMTDRADQLDMEGAIVMPTV